MTTRSATSDSTLEPGMTFGSYTIVRRVGSGGMAAVFEALHTDLKKRVAIKALLPHMAADPDVRARFVREGQAAAKIRHQHVVDIYDVGTHGDVVFLVMEFLQGKDLGRRLAEDSPIPTQQIADLMLPVFASIQAAHSEGILHRDLKPANIFIAEDRNGELIPKVLDFGISKIVSEAGHQSLTSAGTLLGTPNYMAPEQATGDSSLDARCDQYSLGVILYECAVGRRPFEGAANFQLLSRIAQGSFATPRTINPSLPEDFERIILKAMARDADARFPSVHDLGAAVIEFAGDRARALWGPEFLKTQHLTIDRRRFASTREALPFSEPAPPMTRPAASSAGEGEDTFGSEDESSSEMLPAAASFAHRRTIGLAAVTFATTFLIVLAVLLFRSPVNEPTPVRYIAPNERPPEAAPVAHEPYRVLVRVEPGEAQIEVDGTIAGKGALDRQFDHDGRAHTLRATLTGYEPQSVVFRDAPPPSEIKLEPLARPTEITEPLRSVPPLEMKPTTAPRLRTAPASGPARVRPASGPARSMPKTSEPSEHRPTERGANRAPILN